MVSFRFFSEFKKMKKKDMIWTDYFMMINKIRNTQRLTLFHSNLQFKYSLKKNLKSITFLPYSILTVNLRYKTFQKKIWMQTLKVFFKKSLIFPNWRKEIIKKIKRTNIRIYCWKSWLEWAYQVSKRWRRTIKRDRQIASSDFDGFF